MKLTQKQLATLAGVSTPTISRFEQADEDIQLSSVLPILDVLGLTDKRTLGFVDEDYRYGMVEGVSFWGQDGEKRVLCRISREALDDHFSERDKLRADAAFRKHRRDIEAFARRKYLLGQIEPDGSILIRTGDLVT
jgi:transcriptional regulator with XRE-family HTH domain